MRIYDVVNKARMGFWCAAPDEDTAIAIALDAGHARKRENLRVTDVTEQFLQNEATGHHAGITAILNGTETGQVMGQMTARTMADVMREIQSGRPKEIKATRWCVHGRRT